MTAAEIAKQARRPPNDRELRYWLQNMIWDHGYSAEEVRAATGLSLDEIRAAQARLGIFATNRPATGSMAHFACSLSGRASSARGFSRWRFEPSAGHQDQRVYALG